MTMVSESLADFVDAPRPLTLPAIERSHSNEKNNHEIFPWVKNDPTTNRDPSIVANSPLQIERSHSNDNNNHEIVRSVANDPTTNRDSSIVANSPLRRERSHSNDNNNCAIQNDPTNNRDPSTAPVQVANTINGFSIDTSNGGHASLLQVFISNFMDKLTAPHLCFTTASMYALTQLNLEGNHKYDMIFVLVASCASVLLSLSLNMATSAPAVNVSKSIGCASSLQLLVWMLLVTEAWITVHVLAHIPTGVAWPVGIPLTFLEALLWVAYFRRPKLLAKWTKFVWQKIRYCLRGSTSSLHEP